MILQTWGDVIIVSLQQVWTSLAAFVPSFIGAVLVFLIGWVVAEAVGGIVHQVVRALRLDGLLHRLDLGRIAERAGWKLDSGAFAGWIVKWSLVVAFLLASVNILGLTAVSDFLKDVLLYIPNVVIAALVLVIAAIVADVVERAVRGSVEAAGYRGSFAGLVVRWAIWIFAFLVILPQLGVATALIQTVVTGLVAALAIAFGLAFGLGGKDMAAAILERLRSELRR
ncbi:MAG: hypothetical protein HYT41_00245 [Candidatus Sungbacteria bacterium]|nr:hypothetical protein [Candidatus Sungbacteria bacterium]